MLDEQLRKYFIENYPVIKRLINQKDRFDEDVENRAKKLSGLIVNIPDVKKQIWDKFVIINGRVFKNGLHLKVDVGVHYQGYNVRVWVQTPGKDNSTEEILKSIHYFKESTKWDVNVNKDFIPYDTPLEEVAKFINEVLLTVFS
jgi:hypothetical protein